MTSQSTRNTTSTTNALSSENNSSRSARYQQNQNIQRSCFGRMKKEFNWSMLNLVENNPSKFATTAWVKSQIPYLVYRIVCFVYAITILIWKSIDESLNNTTEVDWILLLPTWAFILYTAYHTLALVLTVFQFFTDCLCNDDLLWYHKLNWLLQTITFNASVSCFVGTLIQTLARVSGDSITLNYTQLFSSNDVNFYAIPGTVMVIDVLVSNVTVRLLHAIYSSLFYLIFFAFHIYRWAGGYTPQIYILDYGNYSGEAVPCILVVVLVTTPLVHLFAYGIDTLRWKLLLACVDRHRRRMLEVINARNGLGTCSGSGRSYCELHNTRTTVSFNLNNANSEFKSTINL